MGGRASPTSGGTTSSKFCAKGGDSPIDIELSPVKKKGGPAPELPFLYRKTLSQPTPALERRDSSPESRRTRAESLASGWSMGTIEPRAGEGQNNVRSSGSM